jgi:hypothetical protein
MWSATFMLFLSASLGIIWSAVFIPFVLLGVKVYRIAGIKMRQFSRKTSNHSTIQSDGDPDGWIVGKWYIGYFHTQESLRAGDKRSLYILMTSKSYASLIDGISTGEVQSKKIKYYFREGVFWHLTYTCLPNVKIPSHVVRPPQSDAISRILAFYREHEYCIAFLEGPPGTGKSTTPFLLARELLDGPTSCNTVNMCNTYKPTDPGDTLLSLVTKVTPTADAPLIVILEEVDGVLQAIVDEQIQPHKNIPIQIRSKTDWNNFLDEFQRGIYQYVILVLTSNRSREQLDGLDPSLLREGRISVAAQITLAE